MISYKCDKNNRFIGANPMDANVDYRSDLEHRLETLNDASIPPLKAGCLDPPGQGGCE